MMKLPIFTIALLFFISIISGCSYPVTKDQQQITNQAISQHQQSHQPLSAQQISQWQAQWLLPDILQESSGLWCSTSHNPLAHERIRPNNMADLALPVIFSHNDSGHTPALIALDWITDLSHETPHSNSLVANSISNAQTMPDADIEAMTAHEDLIWLADIGNNSGQRPQLQLLPFDPKQRRWQTPVTLDFPPMPAVQRTIKPYQHDFDAEALVSNGKQLVMFSKSWQSLRSHVYIIDTSINQQSLIAATSTPPLPGVITDAVYDAKTQHYLLLGYRRFHDNLWSLLLNDDYGGFIAILSNHFQLLHIAHLPASGQVEGMCLDAQRRLWVTQEQSERRSAQLFLLGGIDLLLPVAATDHLKN